MKITICTIPGSRYDNSIWVGPDTPFVKALKSQYPSAFREITTESELVEILKSSGARVLEEQNW